MICTNQKTLVTTVSRNNVLFLLIMGLGRRTPRVNVEDHRFGEDLTKGEVNMKECRIKKWKVKEGERHSPDGTESPEPAMLEANFYLQRPIISYFGFQFAAERCISVKFKQIS